LGWLRYLQPIGEDIDAGKDMPPLMLRLRGHSVPVSPLVCYEDTFPKLAASGVRMGAELLVVVTNNAWFGEGGAAYQHAAHSVLRAVETRRPVLRCGNGGWSGWIDEFGNVRAVLKDRTGSIYFRGTETLSVYRDVRWTTQQSFYVRHGDWFVAVCAGLALFGFLVIRTGRPAAPEQPEPEEPEAL
ncbi:MAG TPA: nitrilase-related carbon-nitrogen hydrolase, partial [Opitutaceae bacterium]|nr:nitrilase-related carbon-nitrogen hydrolase [Opitutaceae bacterium]